MEPQQPDFPVYTPCIAGHASVRTDDTVTGDDHRDRIFPDCSAYRLGGHLPGRSVQGYPPGDLSIAHGLAIGYRLEDPPYLKLKRSADEVERNGCFRFSAGEVYVRPFPRLFECRVKLFPAGASELISEVTLPLEPKPGQSLIIGGEENLSER